MKGAGQKRLSLVFWKQKKQKEPINQGDVFPGALHIINRSQYFNWYYRSKKGS